MKTFKAPSKSEVSETNQHIFDNLEKNLGMVPNLYAYFGKNETALADYLALQSRKNTLSGKEREVIKLVVSQVNNCIYCLSAHTVVGKMNGFTDDQVLEIRKAAVTFDAKLAALAIFVKQTTESRGEPSPDSVEALFNAGYKEANLIDILIVIGDKIISNYLHKITKLPVDFPVAPEL
ncbi:carboxymuconolactone decarboxylase family protein [Mucilaginibacter jinjuensis]|uniref:Carboxymuconolactone decarboxylase family protein n=1 Tax=Mucilaginibacter jinjuensis TaxID=1176721 RepID=A0ABY7TE15_9SPHI|nr:carboxymuconolactone decarboxylase family protein [Mucilaginibacter jinjuensis]WCT14271.1 carboxymuconolactone decarboxylase family protein [Mucilaginibacter jinjuensis]